MQEVIQNGWLRMQQCIMRKYSFEGRHNDYCESCQPEHDAFLSSNLIFLSTDLSVPMGVSLHQSQNWPYIRTADGGGKFEVWRRPCQLVLQP
jgi:hypothetical protein